MKNAIATFIAKCRNWNNRQPKNWLNSESAEFQAEYWSSLEYVEKYKSAIAYDLTCDCLEAKARDKEFQMEQAAEKLERQRRVEQIMERGKSYTPTSAPSHEKDEPDLEPS